MWTLILFRYLCVLLFCKNATMSLHAAGQASLISGVCGSQTSCHLQSLLSQRFPRAKLHNFEIRMHFPLLQSTPKLGNKHLRLHRTPAHNLGQQKQPPPSAPCVQCRKFQRPSSFMRGSAGHPLTGTLYTFSTTSTKPTFRAYVDRFHTS